MALTYEPLHFAYENIDTMVGLYRDFGPLMKQVAEKDRAVDLGSAKVCVMVDDVPAHSHGKPPIPLPDVLSKLRTVGVVPDLLVYESALYPIARKILQLLPSSAVKAGGERLRFRRAQVPKFWLEERRTYGLNPSAQLDLTRHDLMPSCPVCAAAWLYLRATFEFGKGPSIIPDLSPYAPTGEASDEQWPLVNTIPDLYSRADQYAAILLQATERTPLTTLASRVFNYPPPYDPTKKLDYLD